VRGQYVVPAMEIYAAGPSLMRDLDSCWSQMTAASLVIRCRSVSSDFYSWISPHNREVWMCIAVWRELIEAVLALTLTAFVGVGALNSDM